MNDGTKAAAYMILSSMSFSLMNLTVRLSSLSTDIMQQVFFRNLIGLIISFLLIRKQGLPLLAEKQYQPMLFVRSLTGYIGVIFLFRANALASQADVALLSRTTPIWVSLFAALILKEKISKIQIPVIVLCMAGAVIAINPSFDSDIVPLLYAMVPAVMSGIAYTMIAMCSGKVHPMTVIFHFCALSTICSGVVMLPRYISPDPLTLLQLFFIGIFAAGGQIGLTYAMQKAPASQTSIYDYSGLVFSIYLGWLVLSEPLKPTTLIGSILIIAGGLWSFLYNNHLHKKTSPA